MRETTRKTYKSLVVTLRSPRLPITAVAIAKERESRSMHTSTLIGTFSLNEDGDDVSVLQSSSLPRPTVLRVITGVRDLSSADVNAKKNCSRHGCQNSGRRIGGSHERDPAEFYGRNNRRRENLFLIPYL